MGKVLDKIIFSFAALFLIFCWVLYLTRNYIISLAVTAAAFGLGFIVLKFLLGRRKSLKTIKHSDMCNSFAVMGKDEVAAHFYNTLPEKLQVKLEPPFFVAKIYENDTLIMVNYKFSGTTADEVAKAYRKCKQENLKKVMILARPTERKIMLIAANLDLAIDFPDPRAVKKYLLNKNALPEKLVSHERKKRVPVNYKEVLRAAFDRRRIKFYIFTALILFAMSFITPLRLYYMIMATIPLLLAGVSAFVSARE
jgi:hypothetical protein